MTNSDVSIDSINRQELLTRLTQPDVHCDFLPVLLKNAEARFESSYCALILLDEHYGCCEVIAPGLPDRYHHRALTGELNPDFARFAADNKSHVQSYAIAEISPLHQQLIVDIDKHGCWSIPIFGGAGTVMGLLLVYSQEQRSPTFGEQEQMAEFAALAGISLERQRLQMTLERQEATLKQAKQIAQMGDWRLDFPDQTLHWSPEMCRIYGLTPETVPSTYRDFLGLLPPETQERLGHHMTQAIATGTDFSLEFSVQRPDGKVVYQEFQAIVEHNHQGEIKGLRGTSLDITERKKTALALQNLVAGTATTGTDFFAALVQNIAAALEVSHAIVTERNDRDLTTLGFWADGELMPTYKYNLNHTPCEYVFQREEFYCSHDVQAQFPKDQDLVDLKAECYLGIALVNTRGEAIGHLYILHQRPLTNPSWAKQILQVFAARAAVELERQQAEAIIQQQLAVMDVTIDGISILKDGHYVYVNQAYLNLFAYTQATELIGQSWMISHSTTEAQRLQRDVLPMLQQEKAWQGEAIATRKNGSTFYADLSWTVTDANLQVQICRDITTRKKAETALQNLIAGTAALTGANFFPALVKHIAEALEASHVFVTQAVESHNQLKFLAAWGDGDYLPNATVDVEGTTCAIALKQGMYHCEADVIHCFPQNPRLAAMEVESYMGVALLDRYGKPMGTLCIFSRSRLNDPTHAEQVLRIFAARAAAEIERQRAESSLQSLIAGTAVANGPDIFSALAQHIAESIPVSYAIISQWSDNKLTTLAVWGNGALQPNSTYDPTQAPCEITLQKGKFYCEHSVQERFPGDPDLIEMEAESYLGIALKNTKGEVIGELCILDQQRIPNPERTEQILNVFATRAAADMERQYSELAINRQLAAIEAAVDGIGILQNETYLHVNQAYVDLFGYDSPAALIGQGWQVLYGAEEVARLEQEVFPILRQQRAWRGEAIATRKDGSTFALGLSLTLTDDDLLISVCRDISDIKEAQALITHNALHDPLTNLPNRTLLLERLDLAIQRGKRLDRHQYAVLFIDLDRFKVINDSLGHNIGDKLLVAIAKRLQNHLRETDIVARLGGDEFLILLEDFQSTEDVIHIANRLLEDCQTPIRITGHQIFTSMSIGIVLGNETYQAAEDLIRDADIAMYRAKNHESNSYKFFDAAMHTQALQRLNLEADLRQAIQQRDFVVYYQPLMDLAKDQLIGFEALVRWPHPTRGLIPPDEFVPIAEEIGFIVALDRLVFEQACTQLSKWRYQFPRAESLKIGVNLSAQDLRKTTLIDDVDNILARTGLPGQFLTLEITESMLIQDINQTIDLLTQLTARNIHISIDDFGTGYSSLNYLHRLPVHNLKIDRSFVSQMQLESRNYKVIDTIVTLSNQLDLTTVAEGIETEQQLTYLRELGCQFGQGYLFAKPLSAQEVEERFF